MMRGLTKSILWCFLVIGVLAPFLANDLPIAASVGGEIRWPVVEGYATSRPSPPVGHASWKSWWAQIPEDGKDWALMPLIPFGPNEALEQRKRAKPVVLEHYLGNDASGRDVLARLIHGAATALWIALGSVMIALVIGIPLGAAAGYWGGAIDLLVTGLVQVFLCFPPIFFVLAVMAFVGQSLWGVVLVLGSLYWVSFARIVRGEILSLRERDYVMRAQSLGLSSGRVLFAHILPQARGPILTNAAFVAAGAIVVEATLAFLGLGPGLSTVSWGGLLMDGKDAAHLGAWHLWLFPSLALVTVVACCHSLASRAYRRPD